MSSPKSLVLQLRPSDRNRNIQSRLGALNPGGKKYLLIYVHCDADAWRIREKGWTYKEALEFIMEGDRSNFNDGTAYADWKREAGEKWVDNMPDATDDPYPFDYGSVMMITRTDNPDEEITVLEWDEGEEDYVIAD